MKKSIRIPVFLVVAMLAVTKGFSSDTIRLRIYASQKPEAVIFTSLTEGYSIDVFGHASVRLRVGEPVLIFSDSGRVGIKTRYQHGFTVDSVRFRAEEVEGVLPMFSLQIPGREPMKQTYGDGLACLSGHGMFLLLNETTIENYLPGVVRSEGGASRHPEFYKAQAVIARTFAWQNILKHANDGYNLCDDTHCQAYHGLVKDSAIEEAVKATAGIVLSGPDSVIVLAAFHSNCGGETASAGDVWMTSLPHLQSVIDPWCTTSRNAVWQKSVPVESWHSMLRRSGYTGSPEADGIDEFSQPSRKQYFEPVAGLRIPVTAIRSEFALRSSFFTLKRVADTIEISGRGYGHGVGLCQEGAMAMALQGKTYGEIIGFYYRNVLLLDVSEVKFPPPVK
ncbi:MAG: SpoIID/LytB domain-containing protein [Bacteroidales bacterium]|nr:SpoIID/LytB domain-containing protein [Bacteroidales bacterium]